MASDLTTVVISISAGALALRALVDFGGTVETASRYYKWSRDASHRAIIKAKIHSRRKTSRLLNFFWFLFTGHPIIGPEDDPPPKPPGGGRKMRPSLTASIGVGTRFAEPKVLHGAVGLNNDNIMALA
jgi:hypothetical protein